MSQIIASLKALIGADVTGFERGAKKVKGGMNDMGAMFSRVLPASVIQFATLGGAIVGVGMAIKKSVDETFAYDNAVRQLAEITGVGAEESSRLLQVMDDFKLTAGDVNAATRAMTREGLSPTLETLAQLSDEYKRLNPGQERAEFLLKKFGRTGLQFAEAMGKGGEALRQMGVEVEKGLIRTDAQIAKTRLAELAFDNWQDKAQALKVGLGSEFLGMMDGSTIAIQKNAQAIFKAANGYNFNTNMAVQYTDAQRGAWQEAELAATQQYLLANGMDVTADSAENLNGILQEMNYGKLISDIGNLQSETDRFRGTQSELNAAIAEANQRYAAGEISIKERDAILSGSNAALVANAEAHKRWAAQTIFSFAQAKAAADGNITEGEGEVLIAAGVQLGLFDEATATTMSNVNSAFDSLDTTNAQTVIEELKKQLEALVNTPWMIPIGVDTSGLNLPTGGHAGGGGEQRAAGGSVFSGVSYLVGERMPEVGENNAPRAGRFLAVYLTSSANAGRNYLCLAVAAISSPMINWGADGRGKTCVILRK